MRRITALLFVSSLVCCFARPILAQEGSATLTGFIQDSSKAVIPGVKVTAVDTNTNQRFDATTGKDGSYTIVSLPVGPYQLQIEKPGFKTILKDDLFLHTQDALQINFQMAVGSTAETVTVTGGTTSDLAGVSVVVGREFIEDMPLNGRSFQDLIALAPGAVNNGGYFSIDGQRNDANYFTVDGVGANMSADAKAASSGAPVAGGVLPAQTVEGTTQALASVDAVEEFQIQTSGYAAEYGRQPGGQVAITTRSGTNEYHGTAFDFFRNTVFDANDWFSNHLALPRGGLHQNDFGGTFGGPLLIPKLYDGKGRSFFFFNYEGLRLLTPDTDSEPGVPTVAFRQSAPPAMQPYLNVFPIPNGPVNPDGITAAFFGSFSDPSDVDSWSLRIDHSFGSKLHLFGRFADAPTTFSHLTQPASIDENQIDNTSSLTLGSTWELTSALVNDLRFNYSRATGFLLDKQDSFGGSTPFPLAMLLNQQSIASGSYAAEVIINIPNTSLNESPDYQSLPQLQRQFNILDSFVWSHGRHSLKAGLDYRRLSPRQTENGNTQTIMFISSLQSIQNGIADTDYSETRQDQNAVISNLSLYVQDHWKITRRLTGDYGLRWDVNPPPSFSSFQLALTEPISNLTNAQFAPLGTPVYHTTYNNFAPRLAFAWTLGNSLNHPITLRAGAGIFYDTGQANAISNLTNGFGSTVYSSVPLPLTASELAPPPISLTPPYLIATLSEPNLKSPYTEAWNLSVDFGLNTKNVLTTSYIGNGGKRLLFNAFFNSSDNPNILLFGRVEMNAANSTYHALQIQDRGYIAPGLRIIGSYTWSHAIDDLSSDAASSNVPLRGNSDFDLRQVFNAALNYEIPHSHLGDTAGRLLGGWVFANRFVAESGYPLQITQGTYYPQGALGLQQSILPNRVAGIPVYLHNVAAAPGGWQLNPAAFSQVPLNPDGSPTANGTLGRNSIYGPAFWNLDTAIQREQAIKERLRLNLRIEAFNILNHPNFGDINTTLGEATFGQAQNQAELGGGNYSPGFPRSLQVSLKLLF